MTNAYPRGRRGSVVWLLARKFPFQHQRAHALANAVETASNAGRSPCLRFHSSLRRSRSKLIHLAAPDAVGCWLELAKNFSVSQWAKLVEMHDGPLVVLAQLSLEIHAIGSKTQYVDWTKHKDHRHGIVQLSWLRLIITLLKFWTKSTLTRQKQIWYRSHNLTMHHYTHQIMLCNTVLSMTSNANARTHRLLLFIKKHIKNSQLS